VAAPRSARRRTVTTDPRSALDALPRVPDQRYGVPARLAQLADLAEWPAAAGGVPGSDDEDVPARLGAIVDAAVAMYGTHGYASPVMLVHAATAPNAVTRALPALTETLRSPSLDGARAAAAAVTAAFAPVHARPPLPGASVWTLTRSCGAGAESGDAHAIKFVDAAIDAHTRSGDTAVLATAAQSIEQITAD